MMLVALPLRAFPQRLDSLQVERPDVLEAKLESAPSVAALYRLALTYRQMGDTGGAVWAARSAALYDDRAAILQLVKETEQAVPRKYRALPDAVGYHFLRKIAGAGPPNLWAALGLISLTLACLLALQRLVASSLVPRLPSGLIWLLGMGAMVSLVLAWIQNHHRQEPAGVLLKPAVLYLSPTLSSAALDTLPAGAALLLGEELDDFVAVKLPTGEEGWVTQPNTRRLFQPVRRK